MNINAWTASPRAELLQGLKLLLQKAIRLFSRSHVFHDGIGLKIGSVIYKIMLLSPLPDRRFAAGDHSELRLVGGRS